MRYSLVVGTLLVVDTDRRMITVEVRNEEPCEETFSYPESMKIKESWIIDKIGKDVELLIRDKEVAEIRF